MMKYFLAFLPIIFPFQIFAQWDNKLNWKDYHLKGEVKYLKEVPYDAINKNTLIEKGKKWSNGEYSIWFDDKGNILAKNEFLFNSVGPNESIFKYSDKNTIEEHYYWTNGETNLRNFYFDDKGHRIAENVLSSDMKLIEQTIFNYDDKGNNIEQIFKSKSKESIIHKITFKYNNKGEIIEKNIYFAWNNNPQQYTYKYDDKGNVIEENWYSSTGKLNERITYQYTFDNQDNWVQRVDYRDGEPYKITERTIEYYNIY